MTSPAETIGDRRYEKYIPVSPGAAVLRSISKWEREDDKIHVEHVGNPEAAVRMLLVHGAGGNSAAMWPYAAHLSELGALVTVPDLPGYGKTEVAHPERVRYGDWQRLLVDLVQKEDDDRPLIIVGASMGGMLAYDAAAETALASHLVVTCLLDPRDPAVRRRLAWHPALAGVAGPVLRLVAGPLEDTRIPVRWLADMRHIANDPGLVGQVVMDRAGGGGRVPLGWMRSYLESSPLVEPEEFNSTPVLMVHPGDDRWTPLELSRSFFNRIAARKSLVTLEGCGHFPTEEPGFTQMLGAVQRVLNELRPHDACPQLT
jgi:alpha-beta hydrolase superfamily lysophospholipase